MDLFENNSPQVNVRQGDNNILRGSSFPIPAKGFQLVDQPSRVEKVIDRASGSVHRIMKLLFLILALITIGVLLKPYLLFICEFSDWLNSHVNEIF